jgi:hypothetical protein
VQSEIVPFKVIPYIKKISFFFKKKKDPTREHETKEKRKKI